MRPTMTVTRSHLLLPVCRNSMHLSTTLSAYFDFTFGSMKFRHLNFDNDKFPVEFHKTSKFYRKFDNISKLPGLSKFCRNFTY